MNQFLRLCLVLHNHQPIGNFDGVFEQAYQDSYAPFLDVFEQYEDLKISLHTSGPLMEWLHQRHGNYLDRLSRLVAAGRLEVIGGAFYEPILTMIPSRDRVGQIRAFTSWLENRLGAYVQGMWIPERVWEQSLTRDLVEAGIKYSVLDDFHFKNAGLSEEQLNGYYITEDDGRLMSLFPGSERLRYLIPFASPQESIDYLRGIAQRHPGAVIVFGDDGEKFGTWPETKRHVYDNGWLRQFFEALAANRDWLHTTTLAEAVEQVPPQGTIYLPDGSYREMTEWALPVQRQTEYDNLIHEFDGDGRLPRVKSFVRGGFWRNFRVKYPEANEMYARMMIVSRRLAEAEGQGLDGDELRWARQALYRSQCNCGYWHGAFGGIYLPHLRNAVYNQLIAAENLLDQGFGRHGPRVESAVDDFNFDARQEVRLSNDKLICLIAPATGGQIHELDVRSICLNLLATLARRPESYHRKVLAGAHGGDPSCASIHERVVFKQAGLDQRVQYDSYLRKSLIDHFYEPSATLDAVLRGQARECGDFVRGVYDARLRKGPDRIQVLMSRDGVVDGASIKITKSVTAEAGSSRLEVTYLLERLPQDRPLHFSVEWNFSGLPSSLDDRYFHVEHQRLGHLGSQLDLTDMSEISLTDEWLGIDVQWQSSRPAHLWTFPIETVSQSEGGFELVHQSVVVQPHWIVRPDADGRWTVTMSLNLDTTMAENRMEQSTQTAAS